MDEIIELSDGDDQELGNNILHTTMDSSTFLNTLTDSDSNSNSDSDHTDIDSDINDYDNIDNNILLSILADNNTSSTLTNNDTPNTLTNATESGAIPLYNSVINLKLKSSLRFLLNELKKTQKIKDFSEKKFLEKVFKKNEKIEDLKKTIKKLKISNKNYLRTIEKNDKNFRNELFYKNEILKNFQKNFEILKNNFTNEKLQKIEKISENYNFYKNSQTFENFENLQKNDNLQNDKKNDFLLNEKFLKVSEDYNFLKNKNLEFESILKKNFFLTSEIESIKKFLNFWYNKISVILEDSIGLSESGTVPDNSGGTVPDNSGTSDSSYLINFSNIFNNFYYNISKILKQRSFLTSQNLKLFSEINRKNKFLTSYEENLKLLKNSLKEEKIKNSSNDEKICKSEKLIKNYIIHNKILNTIINNYIDSSGTVPDNTGALPDTIPTNLNEDYKQLCQQQNDFILSYINNNSALTNDDENMSDIAVPYESNTDPDINEMMLEVMNNANSEKNEKTENLKKELDFYIFRNFLHEKIFSHLYNLNIDISEKRNLIKLKFLDNNKTYNYKITKNDDIADIELTEISADNDL